MEQMERADVQTMVAKPSVPALMALFYGAYQFYHLGFEKVDAIDTYVPFFGSIVSIACVFMYVNAGRQRSISNMLMAMSGIIPYLFSLYMMGYLGIYTLWELFSGFTVGGLLIGLFWIINGYRMLYTFWVITEQMKAA